MKKSKFFLFVATVFLLTSCFGDRLQPIRALGRSEKIEDKTEASLLYQDAIKTLIEAYSSSVGLNKDLAQRLMNLGYFEKAIEHLKIVQSIKPDDSSVYHDLAICLVSLYKIDNKFERLQEAEENYQIALNLAPHSKSLLYDYAQLLVFGTEDYAKAVEVLTTFVYTLGVPDKNGYFLLARVYYMLGDYAASHKVYGEIYQFTKELSEDERSKLEEFMQQTSDLL